MSASIIDVSVTSARQLVELIATLQFPEKYGFDMNSDPPAIPADVESDDEWESHSVDGEPSERVTIGRKRAFSLLSQTYSMALRQPPHEKVTRS